MEIRYTTSQYAVCIHTLVRVLFISNSKVLFFLLCVVFLSTACSRKNRKGKSQHLHKSLSSSAAVPQPDSSCTHLLTILLLWKILLLALFYLGLVSNLVLTVARYTFLVQCYFPIQIFLQKCKCQ